MTQQDAPFTIIATGIDALAAQQPYATNEIAVHRSYDGAGVRLRQVALDAGAVLAEHTAPVPIVVQVVEGAVIFRVDGAEHRLGRGGFVQVDAHTPHEVAALEPSRIVITLIG
ncbi:MAG: cupin domain-containing protein [Leucobacter sp.]